MKQITAFIHHVRTAEVIDALHDAGYKNMALLDLKGTLKPLGEQELAYTSEAGEKFNYRWYARMIRWLKPQRSSAKLARLAPTFPAGYTSVLLSRHYL